MSDERWWPLGEPQARATMNLFCFAHAGGGAASFRAWTQQATPKIRVVPVQLPGRQTRLAEPPFDAWAQLLPAVTSRMMDCRAPFALFGHSFGALVASRVDAELTGLGRPPNHLFVSGARAPSEPRIAEDWHRLKDGEFVERVRGLGGLPDAVLSSPELLELVLPCLRADFALAATAGDIAATATPLTAMYGRADLWTPPASVQAWSQFALSTFHLDRFDGGHFFPYERASEVLRRIAGRLDLVPTVPM